MYNTTNLDRLKIITRRISKESEYVKFLMFCKKFFDTDYKNQLLIYLQYPGATKVNTFVDWKKEGRNVKKNPRKIFLYGYYRRKQEEKIEGQLDIEGVEKNKRKATIEYFNGLPYRRTCNYDITDTYIDRTKKLVPRNLNHESSYSEQEFIECLVNISPVKVIENKVNSNTVDSSDVITYCSNLTLNQNISLLIHQICHCIIHKKLDFDNIKLERLAGETVGFLVANYYGFDTKIYNFSELDEFGEINIENKINLGVFIQRESKEIINLLSERLKNKAQICA